MPAPALPPQPSRLRSWVQRWGAMVRDPGGVAKTARQVGVYRLTTGAGTAADCAAYAYLLGATTTGLAAVGSVLLATGHPVWGVVVLLGLVPVGWAVYRNQQAARMYHPVPPTNQAADGGVWVPYDPPSGV